MKSVNLGVLVSLALVMFTSVAAHATPGDVLCTGEIAKKKIEVILGYDNVGQVTASFIDVSIDGVRVAMFPETILEGKMINVGTEANPFMNWQQGGKDGDNMIALRYPEQDPDAEKTSVYLSLDVPVKKVSLNEIELSCEN